jgi:osmotically-inducible protein OsmY
LAAAEIGVTAREGVVTLSGTVDCYAKKSEAEDAAQKVTGVKVVIDHIEIKTFSDLHERDDTDLAGEVLNAFQWNWEIPQGNVKVKVEDGWITLEGEVQWNYQREAAGRITRKLVGVRGVSNKVTIKADNLTRIEKIAIESALARNWSIKEQDIHVEVSNNTVILSGIVGSWYERDEAERQAWKAPGVELVDNELVVEYGHALSQ